ncbi:hypothetical protein J5N97_025824 [Dioscorea zingiberensis]|uniref:Uncharacterized protein n=1 Tax=Dioscorea zingiberensis TaxID=325984 RepID=A0A9D5C103_9LILI|nr:hypothetical protein J5N97_025824 [Dioscorea zingiberensis]
MLDAMRTSIRVISMPKNLEIPISLCVAHFSLPCSLHQTDSWVKMGGAKPEEISVEQPFLQMRTNWKFLKSLKKEARGLMKEMARKERVKVRNKEGAEGETEEESSDDDDYNQNIDFDDDEDDLNMEEIAW